MSPAAGLCALSLLPLAASWGRKRGQNWIALERLSRNAEDEDQLMMDYVFWPRGTDREREREREREMAGRAAAKVPIARVGQALSRVGTPALVLDLDAFEQNARSLVHQMQVFEKRGPNGKTVALRPHAKAHKCSALALRQMDLLGSAAVGLGCQTLAEAEILASAGEQRDSPVEKNPLLPPSSQVVSHTQEPDAEAIARAGRGWSGVRSPSSASPQDLLRIHPLPLEGHDTASH